MKKVVSLVVCLLSSLFLASNTILASTTQSVSTGGSYDCTVTASLAEAYTVTLPKEIQLLVNSDTKIGTATYEVSVKGNLSGTSAVSVVPDSNFNLKQTGKSDITVTTSQPIIYFKSTTDELTFGDVADPTSPANSIAGVNTSSPVTTEGSMTTGSTKLTGGSWTGVCSFNISLLSGTVQ